MPARLASITFAALVREVARQNGANGGALSPEARDLLRALHSAAQGPGSGSDTSTGHSRTVDHRSGSVFGVAEAASVLGCHPSYVRRLCHTGAIQAQRNRGGWVIEANALDTYRFRSRNGQPRPTPQA